jgi:hypothetical protein
MVIHLIKMSKIIYKSKNVYKSKKVYKNKKMIKNILPNDIEISLLNYLNSESITSFFLISKKSNKLTKKYKTVYKFQRKFENIFRILPNDIEILLLDHLTSNDILSLFLISKKSNKMSKKYHNIYNIRKASERTKSIKIYAMNYNMLRLMSGMQGLCYST